MSIGICSFCEKDYIVTVNGVAACADHIDEAMKPVGDLMTIIREALQKNAAAPVSAPVIPGGQRDNTE